MVRPDKDERKALSKATVLILDDNVEFTDFVKDVAELCGHSAWAITDPSVFKERCSALKPRAVILDIQMPRLDGMHLTQWLGEFAHASKLDVRLIIISGRSESEVQLCRSVAAMSGIEDVHAFNKPVEVATLIKVLNDI